MENRLKGKRILLIDQKDTWRRRSANDLRLAGAQVYESGSYEYPPPAFAQSAETDALFDLVILGCLRVREEESKLIRSIVSYDHRLLVLSGSLPWPTMRSVFLTGADDVTNKPYDSAKLINVVVQALEAIRPRDSYQAVAQGRL